ncbi:MAG TPA: hypothetical protein VLF19_10755 [Methylomirabilota bacterium]|nr:hypothetical protein [Methylomirabilota bacterium]
MKRSVVYGLSLLLLVAVAGCATMGPGGAQASAQPQVKLERVEVTSYFPYAAPPARVPLILAFVFNVTNPNDVPITMDELRFAYAFEAKGEYFTLNSPAVYDVMSIPGRTTNTVRVVSVLDSAIVPATLAVTQGFRLQQLGLKGPDVVKDWWERIGDFGYGIRVTEGVANFTAGKQAMLVTFQDSFPKK